MRSIQRNRRELVTLIGGAAVWPLAARAQQSGKVYRLGQLSAGAAASWGPLIVHFIHGMRELGYIDGQNLAKHI